MKYPNLAKGSQTNANAYEKLAQPSANCMHATLAAMGWAALCPGSTLTFFKQRETLWEPDTRFQDRHWESCRWHVTQKTQLLQRGKAADLLESSVTKVGPSAAGEEAAVTTRKEEMRKHRDAIHKLWLPSKEPRMARIISCVIWVSLRACLASSSTGSGVPFVFSEVPPSLHTVSSRVFNPRHCGKCANKHMDKAGI